MKSILLKLCHIFFILFLYLKVLGIRMFLFYFFYFFKQGETAELQILSFLTNGENQG